MSKPDRFAKLTQLGAQAPLMPLVGQLVGQPSASVEKTAVGGRVARVSVSMPPAEVERVESLARELALATGDKPTTSALVRAGLALLAALPLSERQAAIAQLAVIR